MFNTVESVFSEHIQQDIFLAFKKGGCLLLHESSAESLHSSISNHLSIAISMSPEWMVAKNRFNCSSIIVAYFKHNRDKM